MDIFNMASITTKMSYLNVDGVTIFVAKARILIESKFQQHIKMAVDIVRRALRQYRDEIIVIKNGATMNMVDLAREERIKKYDKLLAEFDVIRQMKRVEKLARHQDEVNPL